MKKSLFFLLVAVLSLSAHAQYPTKEDPFLTQSFAGKSFQQVVSATSGGNITVTGGVDQAKVEMFVWPANRGRKQYTKEEIRQKLAADYDVTLEVNNNTLTVVAKAKKNNMDWKDALSVSFKIYVPQQTATNLRTSGGNITLGNLSGNQDFVTSGGNLHLDQLTGKIKGRTSGGNISLQHAGNDIDLVTSGGNIEAAHSKGHLKLTTSGGNVTLNDLDGTIDATTSGGSIHGSVVKGELQARTSGGNVRLSDISGDLEATTSGGHLVVSLNEPGRYVKLTNSGGNTNLTLPNNKGLDLKLTGGKIKMNAHNNFSGTLEEDRIEGKLNGGGIPVTVRAGSGNLYVTLK